MKILRSLQCVSGVCAIVAIFAGCSSGGSQSLFDLSGSSELSAVISGVAKTDDRQSWMAPDAPKHDLVYVSDEGRPESVGGDYHVYVYSYPQGQLKGTLSNPILARGVCADKAGDVWITYGPGADDVVEYAHGGKSPIATLSFLPGAIPNSCSIDPTTGNLAVTNLFGPNSLAGGVEIFNSAKGTPTDYAIPGMYIVDVCAYDDAGNLFVDGQTFEGSLFQFAELPKGSKRFTSITLNQKFVYPGGVQWDGKYVAVGEQGCPSCTPVPVPPVIYQFSISGSGGKKVGTTALVGAAREFQFWKQGQKVVVPDYGPDNAGQKGALEVFKYPAGGGYLKITYGNLIQPYSAAISLDK